MRRWLGLLIVAAAMPAMAANYGTITADTSGSVEDTVRLRWGCGFIRIGNAASADFGGGTLTLKQLDASGAWATVDTFSAAPDPNPQRLDFGGVSADVGVALSSSTSPDLFWEIQSGNCGSR